MNVVIIDDEADAIRILSIMLSQFCDDVQISGTASSALEGIKLIQHAAPDLVFLDVEMPNGTGFDVLEAIAERNFQVIFTTAHRDYAIKAIKAKAIDYLMKPIDTDELVEAVEQAKQRHVSGSNAGSQATAATNAVSKIPISVRNEYLLIDPGDIYFIQSDGSYSIIHTGSAKYTTAKNLKHYEQLLAPRGFLRVSNSHVINLDKVEKYLREDGGMVLLFNQVKIGVTRSRKQSLKDALGI